MKKIILLFLFISSIALGQNFTLDTTFNPSDTGIYTEDIGRNGVFLDNGKILTGGYTSINGIFSIYRLNNDGSRDQTFTEVLTPSIDCFYANKTLGNFITVIRTYDTTYKTTLKSYDANGSLITSFVSPIITKTNNTESANISKIIFLSDGKFLVLGDFNLVNGVTCNNIVRLNPNGSIDTTFSIGTGFNGTTNACAVQSDGKYVIGGNFSNYNGIAKGKIARINSNGTLDTTFNVYTSISLFSISYGYNPNAPINDIVIQPDGKILTSGADLYANGNAIKSDIVRLNSNGTTDTTFTLGHYLTNYAGKLLYAPDGTIFFSDGYRTLKCGNNGSAIYAFNDTNTEGGHSDLIYQNGKIMVVGSYKNNVGNTRIGYHRLNANGSIDLTFNPGFSINSLYFDYSSDFIYSHLLPDNKILVYGTARFTTYNDIPVKSIFRLTQNGELDTSFNLGSSVNSSMIFQLTYAAKNPIQTKKDYDGTIYIKGNFPSTGILKVNYDGSVDSNFNFPHQVNPFRVTNNNKIIASGTADIFKSGSYFKMVRFNTDSSVDNTFTSPLFTHCPINIELLDDGKMIVSFGDETAFNGYVGSTAHVVRLNENGSLDNSFNIYTSNPVFRTKTINGKTYLSISTAFDGSLLSKCNNDGTKDTSFTPIPVTYSDLYATLSNGRTVTTTSQTSQNNSYYYRVNNNNGIQTAIFPAPTPNKISNLISQSCENIIITGDFHNVNGVNKNNIYRLTVPGSSIVPTPEAALNQLFTSGQTLSDLVVNGQNIQWYTAQNECANNNDYQKNPNVVYSTLPASTLLVNGTTYYASQIINGIESNHRLPITVHQNLGVNEFSLSDLKVYPNPVKNKLTVSNSSVIDKVELYNICGQKIMERNFSMGEISLDFSNYTKGMYLLKIFSKGKNQTCKIISE